MADVFSTRDALNLLRRKKVYFIGDSNMRCLYKDVVCLLVHNRLLTEKQLKGKVEKTFLGDELLRGSPLTRGRDFKEDRRFLFRKDYHLEFHFVTKCLNDDIQRMMRDIADRRITAPDVIVMCSTFWDIQRWGPRGVELFKDNMNQLMRLFRSSLPSHTLVIWTTAPPISVDVRGGFLLQQHEFAKFTMRFHVMEANLFAQQLVSQFGYNVLDFHFHLRMQVHWRRHDGIHWSQKAMRHLTNLLLTHISLAFGVPLPGNFPCALLEKHKKLLEARPQAAPVQLPQVPSALSGGAAGGLGSGSSRAAEPRRRARPVRRTGPPGMPHGPYGPYGPVLPPPPPPLPSYPPPRPPPPPLGPAPTFTDNDFGGFSHDGGQFFVGSDAPQQIQSLWGPVRRTPHPHSHRHNPY